jgi:hypothetical protein
LVRTRRPDLRSIGAWLVFDQSLATARQPRPLSSWRSLMVIAGVATLLRLMLYLALAQVYGGADRLCQWDCGWFVQTIASGYDAVPRGLGHNLGQANWPFFPAYVLAARAVAVTFGVRPIDAALTVSVLATFGFLTVSLRYLELTRGAIGRWLWVAIVLVFPYSFYLSSGYSESLFLLLSTAVLYAFMRGYPYRTAALIALTTATRAIGIVLLPLVIVERAVFAAQAWRRKRSIVALATDLVDSLLPLAIAPLGIVLFMAYLYRHTGDALGFSHVQIGWDRYADFPWQNLLKGLGKWDLSDLPWRSRTLSSLCAIAGIAVTAYLVAQRRLIEAWFCLCSVLIPLSTGLESMPRFLAGTPVFLFALFDLFREIRSVWLRRLVLLVAAVLHLLLLRYWLLGAHFLT